MNRERVIKFLEKTRIQSGFQAIELDGEYIEFICDYLNHYRPGSKVQPRDVIGTFNSYHPAAVLARMDNFINHLIIEYNVKMEIERLGIDTQFGNERVKKYY